MIDLDRNNLDRSASPYLRQHQDNPVHWQEWSRELLDEAARLDRPLFVSVGYATCHWCQFRHSRHIKSAAKPRSPYRIGILV